MTEYTHKGYRIVPGRSGFRIRGIFGHRFTTTAKAERHVRHLIATEGASDA